MATRTNDLTEFAKPIADDMARRCGTLKVALSAGIIALSKLSAEQREQVIAEANDLKSWKGLSEDDSHIKLQEVKSIIRSLPENTIKILGEKDSKILADLRKAIGPEGEAQAAQQHHKIAAKASTKSKSKQCQHDSSISA